MKLALIAAVADNNAIGIDNKMPWHLPDDLRYFKAVTMGKAIIMGRKTFDSLGKALPGRINIVITRNESWHHDGVAVVHTLDDALQLAATLSTADEIMVIGGEQIYRQAIDRADRLYLTRVYQSFDGDAFFPAIIASQWQETSCQKVEPGEQQPLAYRFLVLDRK